jgi:hypothetical protein
MNIIDQELPISLTAGEVMSLIEATQDALYKRLQWSIRPGSRWRDLDLAYAQQMVRDLNNAHGKLYLTVRDLGHLHDEFEDAFTISDHVYELIDRILDAGRWDDIEPHLHAPSLCKVCKEIYVTPA